MALGGHHFVTMLEDEQLKYCSLCENGVKSGIECDYCGVIVDSLICLRSLSRVYKCKVNVTHENGHLQHHWVFGNLPSTSLCIYCHELCGDGVGLIDYRCSLCQATVHTNCKKSVSGDCDMGPAKSLIVPPNCLVYRKAGFGRKKQLVIDSLNIPYWDKSEEWTPLFVFVNPKSGGAGGLAVLRAFRLILHPVQVVNIEQSRIGVSLRWMESYPSVKCYALIAGGDGTISMILDALSELRRRPPVAILPLGTGNDLSRTLGWGAGHCGAIDIFKILTSLKNSDIKMLDRWLVNVVHKRRFGVRAKNKVLTMVNYLSIGVDACVTYGMQSTRDSFRRILSSRFLNKLLFFTFGTKDVLEHACANLRKKIELKVDENIVSLPDIEGLTIINIPNWGAGVKPWSNDPDMFQAVDDGKFEVFGVRSSFHIAQMQVGLTTGLRIAQGKKLSLRIFGEALPMQCDGEAWIQYPGVVQMEIKDQAMMLSLECIS